MGTLNLSVVGPLIAQILRVENATASILDGYDHVRFPSPVAVGMRVRMHATLATVTDLPSGARLGLDVVIEVEGGDRPACTARVLVRHLF
jgi:acyl dehydratase